MANGVMRSAKAASEREMLTRAGFSVSMQRGELVAELDLID